MMATAIPAIIDLLCQLATWLADKMFVVVIVGGLGSVPGTIVAGILLGLIDSFVATLFDSVLAAMVGFAMIIVVLIFRPTGFFGHE